MRIWLIIIYFIEIHDNNVVSSWKFDFHNTLIHLPRCDGLYRNPFVMSWFLNMKLYLEEPGQVNIDRCKLPNAEHNISIQPLNKSKWTHSKSQAPTWHRTETVCSNLKIDQNQRFSLYFELVLKVIVAKILTESVNRVGPPGTWDAYRYI